MSAMCVERAGLTLGRCKTEHGGDVTRAVAAAAAAAATAARIPASRTRKNHPGRLTRRHTVLGLVVAALGLSCIETAAGASDAVDDGLGLYAGAARKAVAGRGDGDERTPAEGLLRGGLRNSRLGGEEALERLDYYYEGSGLVVGGSEVVMPRQEAVGLYLSGDEHG